MTGIDLGDKLTPEHDIIRNYGWNNAGVKYIEDGTAYANSLGIYGGLSAGGDPSNVSYRGWRLADNKWHVMQANNYLLEDSLCVADTGNSLLPPGSARMFHIVYDGPARFKNNHLVGFNREDTELFRNSGASFKHTNPLHEGFTFDPAGPPHSSLLDYNIRTRPGPLGIQPRSWSMAVYDVDGSVSGRACSTIISNHSFMRTSTDYRPANWTNTYRSNHRFAYTTLGGANYGTEFPDITVTRQKSGEPDVPLYYSHLFDFQMELPLIVNEGYFYSYQFHSVPSQKSFTYGIGNVNAGDFVKVRFRDLARMGGLNLTPFGGVSLANVSSKQALDGAVTSAYFKDTATGDLWVKWFAVFTGAQQETRFNVAWTGNEAVTVADTDGDGMGDLEETVALRDPLKAELQFEFNSPVKTPPDGWSTYCGTGVENGAGELQMQSSGIDPQIYRRDFHFNGSEVDAILVRYKSTASGRLQLFWANEDGDFASWRRADTAFSYVANSGYKIAVFNLKDHPEWLGKRITGLRVDTVNGAGATTWIDWIRSADETSDMDGDGTGDLEEVAAGRDPANCSDLAFEFNKPIVSGSFDWSCGNIAPPVSNGAGQVVLTATTGDPQFRRDRLQFPGSKVPTLTVRYKASASGRLQLFWSSEDGGFSGVRSLLASSSYVAGTDYQIAVFNLAANAQWTGKQISALRFDTIGGAGDVTWIDWIRATAPGVVALRDAVVKSAAPTLLKPDIGLEFDSKRPGLPVGWTTSGTKKCIENGSGFLQVKSSGNHPLVRREDLSIDGSDAEAVLVRYKASAAGRLRLSWWQENGDVEPSGSVDSEFSYVENTGYQIAVFNLAKNPQWSGKQISALSLRAIAGAGVTTWIDWIRTANRKTDFDGDGMGDLEEAAKFRDPSTARDLAFEFDSESLQAPVGWSLRGISKAKETGGGALRVVSSGKDPQLVQSGVHFKGSEIETLFVRYKASAAGKLKLYWHDQTSGFSASQCALADRSYVSGSGYEIAEFNLGIQPGWSKKVISGLRLDLINGADNQTCVDWIRAGFGSYPPEVPRNLTGSGGITGPDDLLRKNYESKVNASGGEDVALSFDVQDGVHYRMMASRDGSLGSWVEVNQFTADKNERIEMLYSSKEQKLFYEVVMDTP
ncbi:MAG: hypothetical protein ABI162_06650 [Luteolibacter sp.]